MPTIAALADFQQARDLAGCGVALLQWNSFSTKITIGGVTSATYLLSTQYLKLRLSRIF
jgi:hypothetical protein